MIILAVILTCGFIDCISFSFVFLFELGAVLLGCHTSKVDCNYTVLGTCSLKLFVFLRVLARFTQKDVVCTRPGAQRVHSQPIIISSVDHLRIVIQALS